MSAEHAKAKLKESPRRYERAPRRGEARRAALLRGLEQLLESRSLANVGVNDITKAAGVTRSAFYFYFPTKAAAVAALLEDIYEELLEATGRWHSAPAGDSQAQLEQGFDALLAYLRAHPTLITAIFDAAGADAEVREMWRRGIDELAARVAQKITEERAAGRARKGADAATIGQALVAMNERMLELEARALTEGAKPSATLRDALLEIWRREIYGAAN
jgi:AcrR family transcriptional regulator